MAKKTPNDERMLTPEGILQAVGAGETVDWEFKSAAGGLPKSTWETYSAMANTDGGVIVLGVSPTGDRYSITGLDRPDKLRQDFWNSVNNRNQVSANILRDEAVTLHEIVGASVLAVQVPRASRRQRPIYVGQNPIQGTYRRNYEGDYHCTPEEVGRMLADQAEEPADSQILAGFGLDDLDPASLQQFRQLFSARDPDHAWLLEDNVGLLTKLGGWRRNRQTGEEGLTIAGLLMFGKDEAIRDPQGVPRYQVDYREKTSEDPETRWDDRITVDGTWVANLFQFYQRTIRRLTQDLKVPFRLDPTLYRRDDTQVHEALREALVNAIIHSDYGGMGGIVVESRRSLIRLSNPGSLLISRDQLFMGGISECRNKSLQLMFQMIGGGDKAGSGVDKIFRGWRSQKWIRPSVEETFQPDRVEWVLPTSSMMPDDVIQDLRQAYGRAYDSLSADEVEALVLASVEGTVSNARLQQVSEHHPSDLTSLLGGLVAKGFLEQKGQKRGTRYALNVTSSGQSSASSGQSSVDSGQSPAGERPTEQEWAGLLTEAKQARDHPWLHKAETERIILRLCRDKYLTASDLERLLKRNPVGLRRRFLTPLVQRGFLALRYADELTHPDQAYRTTPEGTDFLKGTTNG